MAKLVYRPKPGGLFVAPQLQPGAVLEVSAGEVEHLLQTGAFERHDPAPQLTTEEPVAEPEKPARNRKEAKNG